MNAMKLKEELVSTLAKYDVVKGIGQTGDMNVRLIPGKSDIDLFVLCSTVPLKEEREALYTSLQSGLA